VESLRTKNCHEPLEYLVLLFEAPFLEACGNCYLLKFLVFVHVPIVELPDSVSDTHLEPQDFCCSYVPCSDRITEAVDKMINLFPLVSPYLALHLRVVIGKGFRHASIRCPAAN